MDRIPVHSSSIVSVGYDEATRSLEVEFVTGGVYRYFDVPDDLYYALMRAESKGAFVNANIVSAGFEYMRVA